MEVGSEGAGELEDRVAGDVEHERRTAAVFVGERAEEEGAYRTKGESEKEGLGYGRGLDMEIAGDRGDAEDEDEEVEGVERPAEEASGESMPLMRTEAPERARHRE
jgi:hypothetical protein